MNLHPEDEILNTYNIIADNWHANRTGNDFWADEHKKFGEFLPSGRILDIGCGSGRDSFWFVENGYEYLGIDGSASMIKLAKKNNPKARFKLKNFFELFSRGRNFDGFWAAASLLHVPKNQILGLLKTIKSQIKPGGIGFISLKEGIGEKEEVWTGTDLKRFFVYYSKDEFKSILESAGFSILEAGTKIQNNKHMTWITFFVKV